MEAKINIAEILKDKPTGISLWSMTLAKCTLQGVDNNGVYSVCVRSKNTGDLARYSYKGRWNEGIEDSECVLFPSKEMRDWSKFAWKKGDVLVCVKTEYVDGENIKADTWYQLKNGKFVEVNE